MTNHDTVIELREDKAVVPSYFFISSVIPS